MPTVARRGLTAAADAHAADALPGRTEHARTLAAVVLALAIAAVWLVPRQTGDLYVAYAGARDVLDGKLGAIDDWSFANPGRRWINQNWGTHLLYYGVFRAAGPGGIVALKLTLIASMAAAVVVLVRAHSVGRVAAYLVTACVLVAAYAYVDLRPNLVTLVWSPVLYLLLLRTRDRPALLWAAVALVWLWSNMHGGYVLGLALLCLWCVLRVIGRDGDVTPRDAGVPRPARRGAVDSGWAVRRHLVAAPLVAIALVAAVNPFGVANLTHPFVTARSAAWREVVEWMPIFTVLDVDARYGSRIEFLVVLTVLVVLIVARLLSVPRAATRGRGDLLCAVAALGVCVLVLGNAVSVWPAGGTPYAVPIYALIAGVASWAFVRVATDLRRGSNADAGAVASVHADAPIADPTPVAATPFAVIVATTTIAMALTSRRFVPVAMIATAPLLATHLEWLRGALGRWGAVPIGLAAAAIALPTVRHLAVDARHYALDNPRHPHALSSPYDRMLYADTYPHGAAEFVDRNRITGRVYEDWRWEGFLHWRCPELSLDVGGRAQQVYDEASYRHRTAIWNGRDETTGELVDRSAALAAQGIRYVLVSLRTDAGALVAELLRPGSPWTIVYFDRETNVMLADTSSAEVAELVRRVVDGVLWYPDAGTAVVSRGLAMSCMLALPAERRRDALVAANAAMPKVAAYHRLVDMMTRGELAGEWLRVYLQREYERLATFREAPHEALDTLRTRHRLGELLLAMDPASADAARLTAETRALGEALARLEAEWPP